mgnify:FL=1
MADQKDVIGEVILRDVRLSFAHLFEAQEQENDDGTMRYTYNAAFLFDKKDDPYKNKARIQKAADEAKAKKWGSNPKDWPKLKPEKICLRDGDLEDYDGYEGQLYVSSNSPQTRPPQVVTNRRDAKTGSWIEAAPGQKNSPYSGCYVNAVVRLWAQDNKHGKRINASLEVVQFLRDGDAFGAAPVNADDKFTDDMVGDVADIGDDDDGDDDSGLL